LGGVQAAFDVAIGSEQGFPLNLTGKFSVNISALYLSAFSDFIVAKADGVLIQHDPKGDDSQEILRIARGSLAVNFADFEGPSITGEVENLIVRGNGFSLTEASLTYSQPEKIKVPGIIEFD